MHILWNAMRFFIFSFFLYGTAYGIFFLILRDLICCMKLIFENLGDDNFLYKCLFSENPEDSKFLDETLKISVIQFFSNKDETCYIQNTADKCYDKICKSGDTEKSECAYLKYMVEKDILGSFDCSFLRSDLHHLYKTLEDASNESRYLSAISLCSSFFGTVAIYFYLLVIHHYNNELFFDSGKSIFTGFDGFGKGYQRKNHSQDPAYKKRKLRAEIELTSKNEEENLQKKEDEE